MEGLTKHLQQPELKLYCAALWKTEGTGPMETIEKNLKPIEII